MIPLKPCPFCGGMAGIARGFAGPGRMTFTALCLVCNTAIFRPRTSTGEWLAFETKEGAAEAWNRRAE